MLARPLMIHFIFLTRVGTCNFSFIRSHCYVSTQALDARVTNSTSAVALYATLRIEWLLTSNWPIPVAARECDRSLLVFPHFNPAWSMDLCLVWELCATRQRSLFLSDQSSRDFLPTLLCRSVIVNSDKDEALAHYCLLRHGKINIF